MFKKREIKKKTLNIENINDKEKVASNYEIAVNKKIKTNNQYST